MRDMGLEVGSGEWRIENGVWKAEVGWGGKGSGTGEGGRRRVKKRIG